LQAIGVEVPIMDRDPHRWRFRLSTLMLLVISLALALTLVIERRRSALELERLRAAEAAARDQAVMSEVRLQKARDASRQALANAQQTRAQSDATARSQRPPGESPERTTDR
jgi:hypothetical protein